MFHQMLEKRFSTVGLQARVTYAKPPRAPTLEVDVDFDQCTEFFALTINPWLRNDVAVLDARDRHVLMRAGSTSKLLLGHDERHLFVVSVPNGASVSNVRGAMEALKPEVVNRKQVSRNVKWADRNRRRNRGFVRQGEWFFVPIDVVPQLRRITVQYKVPLPRMVSASAPHTCDELVYIQATVREHTKRERLLATDESLERLERAGAKLLNSPDAILSALDSPRPAIVRIEHTVREHIPERLLVRGCVRHRDHKTIQLREWHEAHMAGQSDPQVELTETGQPTAVIRYID